MLKVTVPVTVEPALTLAGKLRLVDRSASAEPPIVAVALLFAALESGVVAVTPAVTVELAAPGCVKYTVIGPTAVPDAKVAGIPLRLTTPLLAA